MADETWAGHKRCQACWNLSCSCDYDHEASLDRQARAYVWCMANVGGVVHPKDHADGKEWERSGRDLPEAMRRVGLLPPTDGPESGGKRPVRDGDGWAATGS